MMPVDVNIQNFIKEGSKIAKDDAKKERKNKTSISQQVLVNTLLGSNPQMAQQAANGGQ